MEAIDVRFGSKGDIESGHQQSALECLLSANSGHSNIHSISSSARCCMPNGTSRPSAFAVLRLMTRLNLVGACTGRSAGLAPCANKAPGFSRSRSVMFVYCSAGNCRLELTEETKRKRCLHRGGKSVECSIHSGSTT